MTLNKITAAICTLLACNLYAEEKQSWIVTDGSNENTVKQMMIMGSAPSIQSISSNKGINIYKMASSEVANFSEMLHVNNHKCGGYTSHNSLEEAQLALAEVQASQADTLIATSYSINNSANVTPMLEAVNASNIAMTIEHLSTSYANRYYTTSSGLTSAQWIHDNWASIAQGRSDISVEYFDHASWDQPSIILTITGTESPDEVVVLGAHIDSTVGNSTREGTFAPGADDDASGVAVLTEALNVVVDKDYHPQKTIKLMGYAAEEVGLLGSDAIAKDYKAQGVNVIGVMQLDMTNFHGSFEDITIFTDYTNSAQNNFLVDLIETYQNIEVGYSSCGYGCSDHASWYQQGFAASMPFESSMSDINPNIHSANDTLANSDANATTSVPFAKLALSYMGELAKGSLGDNPTPEEPKVEVVNFSGSVSRNEEAQLGSVPAKAGTDVIVEMTGTNDADLYVALGSEASTSNWECRPYASGSSESCTVTVPANGDEPYIMVRGYSSRSSSYNISATYTPK
ncbi:MAG: M20/M25/M40 family metallo-hydrolase [Marinomonas sp.]